MVTEQSWFPWVAERLPLATGLRGSSHLHIQ